MTAQQRVRNGAAVTLQSLANAKHLPVEFLRDRGLTDLPGGGVGIPYFDAAGNPLFTRERDSVRAGDRRFYQPKGVRLAAYGLNRLDRARKAGEFFLVEGESDAWALWHADLPAIGLPGANVTACLSAECIEGIERIYVHQEPDAGGTAFIKGVATQLAALGFEGEAFAFSCPGVKDPADLYVQAPERFRERMEAAAQTSKALRANVANGTAHRRGDAWEDPRDCTSTPPSRPAPSAQSVCLAGVQAQAVEWLWPCRIPRGAITTIDGDPDLGKSSVTLDLAARVSRGWCMPPDGGPAEDVAPADVLLISAEDDLARTIRPRLEAMGADLSRIHALEEITLTDHRRPPILPDDLAYIGALIEEHRIALVVVDPFMAFLSGRTDAHKDQDVRRVMHGLKLLAVATGAAIILVRHLNKLVQTESAMHRGGGSIGIIGAARSGLLIGRHPKEPAQRVIARIKGNLCPPPESLAYTFEPTAGGVARIAWVGPMELTADDLLAQPTRQAEHRKQQLDKDAETTILVALDRLDPERSGVSLRKLRDHSGLGRDRATAAVARPQAQGILAPVTIEAPRSDHGGVQRVEGTRRPPL